MATASVEIERKYDVDAATAVPDLAGLDGVAQVAPAQVHELVATYLDTDDLRLRRAGITLRHRAGGTDAGWHLKVPLGSDREELHVPGNDPTEPVPVELRALVRAVVHTAAVAPVARLRTVRTTYALLGADGARLAEVVDDEVHGVVLPETGEAGLRWREWEAELAAGDRGLLDEVEQRLLAAGAVPSGSGSKVGRVLAVGRPGPLTVVATPVTRRSPAAEVLRAHLREQVDELVRQDPAVRRDLPDAVHAMRVATRRLRSALKTFRPLLDRPVTDPVRDELRWLAGVLGAARDAEVLHARLNELLAAEPPELVLDDVQRRVAEVMGERYRQAHHEVVAELDGERYLRLLDALDALAGAPPTTSEARKRAGEGLPRLVRGAWRRLDRAMRAAESAAPVAAQDELLHAARKDAKAARYAAESVVPVMGSSARRFARAQRKLQDVLGEHQDGVVLRDLLRELAGTADAAAFTFGRLHALEQVRSEAAAARWPAVRSRASRRKLRRWL